MNFNSEFNKIVGSLNAQSEFAHILHLIGTKPNEWEVIKLIHRMDEPLQSKLLPLLKPLRLRRQELLKPLKNPTLSEKYRLKGNSFYRKNMFADAVYFYSESIRFGKGQSLALAYANRGLMFYLQEWHLEALKDFQLALDHKYPKKLEYKLRVRQVKCWTALNYKQEAIISFELAKKLMVTYSIHNPTMMSNISMQMSQLPATKKRVQHAKEMNSIKWIEKQIMEKRRKLPYVHKGRNPLIPSASSSVKLTTSAKGRGLVATEDLEPGTVVIVDRPLIAKLADEFKGSHCHYCLHWDQGLTPCLRCSQVGFCSTICRDRAWKSYHQHECGLVDLLQRTGIQEDALLALRTVLEMDRATLTKAQSDLSLGLEDVYSSTDYRTVHNFDGRNAWRLDSNIFYHSVMAIHLTVLVRGEFDFAMAVALLRLICKFQCSNVFLVNQMFLPLEKCPKCSLDDVNRSIGVAVYPVLSLVNHACDGNVKPFSVVNGCVVRVIQPIKKGEEMTMSYGVHYAFHSKELRQSTLKKNHNFDCCCVPCVENWPLEKDLPTISIKHSLFYPIARDLARFNRKQNYYIEDLRGTNMWIKKFLGYLRSIDGARSITRPVREYFAIQSALNHSYYLTATVGPKIPKRNDEIPSKE